MAAPNQSRSPMNAAPTRAPPIYAPPKTPEEVVREQKRVTVLLEINARLLQHVSQLQEDGMGGLVNPSQQQTSDQANMQKMATQEYILCLRCMQANITWLAASATPAAGNNRVLSGPVIMDSPIESAELELGYAELKALFPGWRGFRPSVPGGGSQSLSGQGQLPPSQNPLSGQNPPFSSQTPPFSSQNPPLSSQSLPLPGHGQPQLGQGQPQLGQGHPQLGQSQPQPGQTPPQPYPQPSQMPQNISGPFSNMSNKPNT